MCACVRACPCVWMCVCVRVIFTYIHTYMHACVHACIHKYIHPCMHACIHTCMHTCIHACMHTYMHTCTHAYIHACILYIYCQTQLICWTLSSALLEHVAWPRIQSPSAILSPSEEGGQRSQAMAGKDKTEEQGSGLGQGFPISRGWDSHW